MIYIINKLKNPQAAGNLLTEIEHVYTNLVCNPEMYAYSEDFFMKSRRYRKAVISNYDYVIIFRIDEVMNSLYIVGYFHNMELYINKL